MGALDAIGLGRKARRVTLRYLWLAVFLALELLPAAPALAKEADEGNSSARAKSPAKAARSALPEPKAWLPSKGRECRNRGKYRRFCAGPRRVAAPTGRPGERGKALGLGSRKVAGQLLVGTPEERWVEAAGATKAGSGLRWPVPGGKFWRGFGRVHRGPKRKHGHKGVDVGAPEGSPILATQSGIVAYANNELRGYGNVLMIVHGDGTTALYAHCKAIFVFPGQRVKQGRVVALVGHTGIARGTHLHFEYRKRGRPRDPLGLFVDAPASADKALSKTSGRRRRERAAARGKRGKRGK